MRSERTRVRVPPRRSVPSPSILVSLAAAAALLCGCAPSSGPASPGTAAPATSSTTSPPTSAQGLAPSALVDTFVGTGIGGKSVGSIDTFPGADMPFGMLQWSPDTSPDRTSGGGYAYRDSATSGFSLTHMSGPGCAVYGDIPILPTVGAVGDRPGGGHGEVLAHDRGGEPGQLRRHRGPARRCAWRWP